MNYLSVFSGIEAASVAWKHLGWKAVGFSEIDPFASAVLAHHYPETKNYGDITKHKTWGIQPGTVDILIGGSPCQSYSSAGQRLGLKDPRGQLMFSFINLAEAIKCRFICWENVPGVLSSSGGNDFKCFLSALANRGYGFAWRVLDAQFVGGTRAVPQRRKRVYLVGSLDGWECCTKILSFQESLCWNFEKGKKQRKEIACNFGASLRECNKFLDDLPLPVDFRNNKIEKNPNISGTLQSKSNGGFSLNYTTGILFPASLTIRRLTPLECSRLMGFPDNYTQIPWKGKPAEKCPDSLQYKAIGNSMAVPCVQWIGQRINDYVQNRL